MRFAILTVVMLFGLAGGAGAQDGHYRRAARIEVRTPIGDFTVREGEVGFTELVRRPYSFRPGFLYEYQNRCRGARCLVEVRSLRDGRLVGRIDAPRAPRWLIEVGREPTDMGPPAERGPDEDEELLGEPR
jgi:hypothetical protein